MINRIFAKNFMGQSWEYSIEEGVNLFDGPNGNGKTSVRKALLLALGQDTGDDIKQDTQSYYEHYCGEECGEMVVGFETEAGELVKTYTKKSNMEGGEKITCKITFNDKNVLQREDIMGLTGTKIFDPVKFLGSTPSQRTSQLCALCDSITPEQLEELDKRIDEASDERNKLVQEKRIKEHALEDTQKSLKDKVTQDGIDYTGLAETAEKLTIQRDELRRDLNDAKQKAEHIAKAKEDAEALSARLIEMQSKVLPSIEGEEISVEALEKDLATMEGLKATSEKIDHLTETIESKSILLSEPQPIDTTQEAIDEMEEQLNALDTTSRSAEVDQIVYDAFYALWLKLKAILPAEVGEEAKGIFSEAISPYKERIAAAQKSEESAQIAEQLQDRLRSAKAELIAYNSKVDAYTRAQRELTDLNNELLKLGESEYDHRHHEDLKTELIKANLNNGAVEKNSQLHSDHARMIEQLTEDLSKASQDAQDQVPNTDELISKGKELTAEIERLAGLIQQEADYKAVKKLADGQMQDIFTIDNKLSEVKSRLFKATREKTELLQSLADTIQSKCAGIITPWTIELDIKGGRNGYVRFLLCKPNGSHVPLEVACGGEKVMIFAALTVALLGDTGGVVLSECAELDSGNTRRLITRLKEINSVQSILFGHSLEGAYQEGVSYTKVGGEA